MVTVAKLGLGAVVVTAKGVKLFADVVTGKAPDFRIDEGESNGPNSDTHVHFGNGAGQSVGAEVAGFLLGAASTNYNLKRRRGLEERDYILSDEYTLRNLKGDR